MSNINPQSIDGTYPIAGQDNNSQGFRDNFTNIINNFTFASAELNDLQTYAVLTGPLGSVGQTGTPINNMNYTYLTAAQLIKATETLNDLGNLTSGSSFAVDWTSGHFQTVGVTNSATMTFRSSWPNNNLWTKLRVKISSYGTTSITLPATVTADTVSNLQGYTGNSTVTVSSGVYVWEFSTHDNGSTVVVEDVLRNYNTVSYGNLNVNAIYGIDGNVEIYGNVQSGLRPISPHANSPVDVTWSANNYVQINIQNINTVGNLVSSDIVATTPDGTDTSKYIDMGINGNNFSSASWTISGAGDGYVYVNSGNLTLGTDTAAKDVIIHNGGTTVDKIAARFFESTGNVVFFDPVNLSANANLSALNSWITASTVNITGNLLAAVANIGTLNTTGNILGATGIFNGVQVGGTVYANATATVTGVNTAPITGALVTTGGAGIGGNVRATGYIYAAAAGGAGTGAGAAANVGIAPAYQYYAMNANLALPNGAGDVKIFNANVFLAAATTYEFEVQFGVFRNITAVTSTQLQFNLGAPVLTTGTAGINWINYVWTAGNASPGSYGGTVFGAAYAANIASGRANVATNVAITAASTASAADIWMTAKGIFTTSTAGWLSPAVAYTAAPGGVSYVQGGSYMKIAPVGFGAAGSATAGGNVLVGSWA